MRIAVFHCPQGVSAEGIVQAFLDAGVPRAYLKRESKKQLPKKTSSLIHKINYSLSVILSEAKDLEILRPLRGLRMTALRPNDSIIQIAFAIQYFGIDKFFLRSLAIGKGGNPRTLKLLKGFILNRLPINQEIVTPPGAAILSILCEREVSIPPMQLETVGFGAGKVMISIGKTVAPYRRERILVLETNIDDMSPQGFELLYERLFKAGALDVWVESILMKKMRPAFKLSVLLNHTDQEKICREIFRETPTLGVRFLEMDRFSLTRHIKRTRTPWGKVRMKFGFSDTNHSVGRPEYEDVKRVARSKNLSFRQAMKVLQTSR